MKDNFSKQSKLYSIYRPVYPKTLYETLLKDVKNKNIAWDCATGNGQVASELSNYVGQIYATDISQSQLDNAIKKDNIIYSVSSAEKTSFADNYFDLITVAQALHWFNFEEFNKEVKRIGNKNGIIAVWGYSLIKISSDIDKIVFRYYKDKMGPYWDNERRFIDEEYKNIPFPFDNVKKQKFEINLEWNLNDFEGYLNTWSALQHFMKKNNYNPVSEIISELKPFWKEDENKKITFPVFFQSGKIR